MPGGRGGTPIARPWSGCHLAVFAAERARLNGTVETIPLPAEQKSA
jgi:hypothetical protein